MDRSLGRATCLANEFETGQTVSFVQKIISRKIPQPEVFPPYGFLFATMPVQQRREKPPRLLLCRAFVGVIGHPFHEACTDGGNPLLPGVEFWTDFRRGWGRSINGGAIPD